MPALVTLGAPPRHRAAPTPTIALHHRYRPRHRPRSHPRRAAIATVATSQPDQADRATVTAGTASSSSAPTSSPLPPCPPLPKGRHRGHRYRPSGVQIRSVTTAAAVARADLQRHRFRRQPPVTPVAHQAACRRRRRGRRRRRRRRPPRHRSPGGVALNPLPINSPASALAACRYPRRSSTTGIRPRCHGRPTIAPATHRGGLDYLQRRLGVGPRHGTVGIALPQLRATTSDTTSVKKRRRPHVREEDRGRRTHRRHAPSVGREVISVRRLLGTAVARLPGRLRRRLGPEQRVRRRTRRHRRQPQCAARPCRGTEPPVRTFARSPATKWGHARPRQFRRHAEHGAGHVSHRSPSNLTNLPTVSSDTDPEVAAFAVNCTKMSQYRPQSEHQSITGASRSADHFAGAREARSGSVPSTGCCAEHSMFGAATHGDSSPSLTSLSPIPHLECSA